MDLHCSNDTDGIRGVVGYRIQVELRSFLFLCINGWPFVLSRSNVV